MKLMKWPANKAELEAGILDVWEGLPAIDVENYFMHYDSRISQCIDNGGGHIDVTCLSDLILAKFLFNCSEQQMTTFSVEWHRFA